MKDVSRKRIREAAAIIVRPRGTPRSVYLVERKETLSFFGGYLAFIGGAIDAADGARAAGRGTDDEARFLRAAARELFEETGVLLARAATPPDPAARDRLRRSLLDGSRDFDAVLAEIGGEVDARRLCRVCRITTPPFSPIRFETVFYLVDVGGDESPSIVPGELVCGEFVNVDAALSRWRQGTFPLVPPAVILLKLLSRARGDDPTDDFLQSADALTAQYARGKIQQVFFTPGIRKMSLLTDTRPPADHTNAYLVGTERLYLIDPGAADAAQQARLFEALDESTAERGELQAVLLTHHHPDHVGSVTAVAERYGVAVWAHAAAAAALRGTIAVERTLDDGETIDLGESPDGRAGWRLRVIHTPGHAPGHLAFQESRYHALIVGDMVSTISTIVIAPPQGHLGTYLASLRRLRELEAGTLYPAHGPAQRDSHAVIDRYLAHRAAREEKILRSLGPRPATLDEILGIAYDDVAPPALPLARLSLAAGLQKLIEDEKVEATAGRYRRITGPNRGKES